jgi:hypothetical protein
VHGDDIHLPHNFTACAGPADNIRINKTFFMVFPCVKKTAGKAVREFKKSYRNDPAGFQYMTGGSPTKSERGTKNKRTLRVRIFCQADISAK